MELSANLTLPKPQIKIGPDPSVNEWNMAVVGHPIWVWTNEANHVNETLSEAGITVTIQAVRNKTTFNFGDGTTLTCTTTTPYPGGESAIGKPSPTCGHTYTKPSLPKGAFTITATAQWTFTWSALGYSGTLPGQSSATRAVRVGELQSVTVRKP